MLPPPSKIRFGDPIFLSAPLGSDWGLTNEEAWERAVAVDITGDGRQEVVISTSPEGSNNRPEEANPLVVLGWRDGALVELSAELLPGPVGGSIVRNFVTGDFNGDGITDILVNNTGTEAFWPFPGERNVLLMSDGMGRYADASHLLPEYTDFSHGSVAADFTGNGHVDLFINNLGERDNHISYLLVNQGDGTFSEPQHFSGLFGWGQSPRFDDTFQWVESSYHNELMDYGGNGIFDLYWGYTHWYGPPEERPDNLGFSVAVNDGEGNFTLVYDDALAPDFPLELVYDGTMAGEMTRAGDITGNGLIDLVVFWDGPDFDHIQILENHGPDGYVDVSHRLPGQENGGRLPNVAGTPDFFLTDLDGDGDLDILMVRWTVDFSERVVLWFENDGAGNFTRLDPDAFPGTIKSVIADVNGDGVPDLIYEVTGWDLPVPDTRGLNYAAVRLGEALPNAPATISGDTAGVVVELDAARQTAAGALTVTDPNPGEDRFQSPADAALLGRFGSFTFDPDSGAWSYALEDRAEALRLLEPGAQGSDTLEVTSLDGSASETIIVTVTGTELREDPAILTLSGGVLDRAGAPMAEAAVTFTPFEGDSIGGATAADGQFAMELPLGSSGVLSLSRDVAAGEVRIGTASALETLRMAVGLNPSWGTADALDFIAADIDGDGRVTTADALALLRLAVGLSSEAAPRWVFVPEGSDLSSVDRTNVAVPEDPVFEMLMSDVTGLGFTGLLVGQVQAF